MNKQMLESFSRMYKEGNKKLRESSNMDKINAVLNKIAFIDVSGSNSAPDMLKVSEKLAKDAGAQKLMYFADKIGTTPNGLGGGTYYEPIQKYLNDNNISKAIVVTDQDVEMNEDGKYLQKDPRVTIIRNDKYHDDPEAFLNGTFDDVRKSIPHVIGKTSKTGEMTSREKLQKVLPGLKFNESLLPDDSSEVETWIILKYPNSTYAAISDNMDDVYGSSIDEIRKKIEKHAHDVEGPELKVDSIEFNDKSKIQVVGEIDVTYLYPDNLDENKKSRSSSKRLKESIDKKYIMFDYNDPETLHFVKNIPENSDLWDDYNYIIKEVTNLKGKHLVTNDDESIIISDSDIDDSDREAFEYAKEYFEANPTENKFIDDEWGGLVITRADIEKGLDNFTLISDFKIDNGYYDGDSSSVSQWIDFDKIAWEDYSNDSASDFTDANISSQEDFDIRGDKLFSYDGNAEIVIIPSSIKRIGEEAFYENKKIKKVFIPNSVVKIGDNAFKYCSKLKIYCETSSEPDDWSSYWNPHGRPVIWGAKVQDLNESYKNSNQLNQLKESLGSDKFNKIQKIIKECLKEGIEVEITIPKKRK